MVGVDSGSLYRRTYSLSRLAWSWVGGCLAPFYIHQTNRVNTHNGSTMLTAPQTLLLSTGAVVVVEMATCNIMLQQTQAV